MVRFCPSLSLPASQLTVLSGMTGGGEECTKSTNFEFRIHCSPALAVVWGHTEASALPKSVCAVAEVAVELSTFRMRVMMNNSVVLLLHELGYSSTASDGNMEYSRHNYHGLWSYCSIQRYHHLVE